MAPYPFSDRGSINSAVWVTERECVSERVRVWGVEPQGKLVNAGTEKGAMLLVELVIPVGRRYLSGM